jgi:ABC-type glutathione transport system ATPase component
MSVMQIAQTDAPIIEVQHLYKDFAVNSNAIKSGKMRALSDITFNLHRGRALAVVGNPAPARAPSPRSSPRCTSSPTAASSNVAAIEEFNKGTALLDYRQSVQMVWQDPFTHIESDPHHLPPHRPPPLLHSKVSDKRDLPDMVYGLLEKVGLTPPRRPRPSTRTSFRRPAPAGQHRPQPGGGGGSGASGRTHLHARRLHSHRHPQPDGADEERARRLHVSTSPTTSPPPATWRKIWR